MIVLVMMSQ